MGLTRRELLIGGGATIALCAAGYAEATKRTSTGNLAPNHAAASLVPRPNNWTLYNSDYMRLDGPSDCTLEHKLFQSPAGACAPMQETLPGLEKQFEIERILLASVRSDQALYIDARDGTILGVLTLEPGTAAYNEWRKNIIDPDPAIADNESRRATINYAKALAPGVAAAYGIKRDALGIRVGYADILARGLERVGPYVPYLMTVARNLGLDPRLGVAIALQETNFLNRVSGAACEGVFQMGRQEAKTNGILVPSGRAKALPLRVYTPVEPNESFHPLLEVEAAMQYIRTLAYVNGSLFKGVSSYHTGPDNVIKMHALALFRDHGIAKMQKEALAKRPNGNGCDVNIFSSMKKGIPGLSGDGEDIPGRRPAGQEGKEELGSLVAMAWSIVSGFRDKLNKGYSGFKGWSSQYPLRTAAIMNVMRHLSVEPISFAAIRVSYRGKERVTANDVLEACGDERTYFHLNPHLPTIATTSFKGKTLVKTIPLPDGMRVMVPIERAAAFARRIEHKATIDARVYTQGKSTPPPPLPRWTPEDKKYAVIAQRRSYGGYEAATKEEIAALKNRFEVMAQLDPSAFRMMQWRTALFDLSVFEQEGAKRYSIALAGMNPADSRKKPTVKNDQNTKKNIKKQKGTQRRV